ncbi:hypothetical protein SORBI_3009G116832 [Sorghum bicolor]|uniref:Uncharacterized protein n=1 Tax=Sorghum bicolor TaxID=4558 RepID=A0A1Z5R2X3_SORBI|nr:hypothetical protein SORBI_3009G116832 [Sorghum bicolor]
MKVVPCSFYQKIVSCEKKEHRHLFSTWHIWQHSHGPHLYSSHFKQAAAQPEPIRKPRQLEKSARKQNGELDTHAYIYAPHEYIYALKEEICQVRINTKSRW